MRRALLLPVQRKNLLANGSFEDGVTGWTTSSGTVTWRSNDGALDDGCMEVAGSAASAGAITNPLLRDLSWFPIRGRGPHTLSFYAKTVSGDTDWQSHVWEYNAAGTALVLTNAVAFTAPADWTRFEQTYTPTNPATVYLAARFSRVGATAGAVKVDNVMIEAGAVATAYAPR